MEQTYYERNKERVRARAKEYYLKLTEGKVTRRNKHREHPEEQPEKRPRGRPKKVVDETVEKKPRGRPRKQVENVQRVNPIEGAYVSPPNSNDVIFEELLPLRSKSLAKIINTTI